MKLGEFFVQLGVNAETKSLGEFTRSLGSIPMSAVEAIAALAGIQFELIKMADIAMRTAIGFQSFTAQTGLSWKELQRWQIVAEQVNVDAGSVASSIEALQRNMAEIRLGRGNISPFQMLGIGVNQTAFQVLDQLRQRIKGLDSATAVNIISQMGLTPDMIKILQLSDREFKKFAESVHGLNDRQVGDFLKAKQSLVQLGQTFRFTMFDMVSHFTEAIEKASAFRKVMVGVGVAAAALAVYFFPVTAAIVGLLLLLDDLAVYFEGGDSVFGLFIDSIKKVGEELKSSFSHFDNLAKLLTLVGTGLLPGGAAMGAQALAARSSTVNQTNNISVHGSGPADETAKAVHREINRASMQVDNQGH